VSGAVHYVGGVTSGEKAFVMHGIHSLLGMHSGRDENETGNV
jgi:hypothetical protein